MNRHICYSRTLAAIVCGMLLTALPASAQYNPVSVAGQSVANISATSAVFNGSASIGPWGASSYFQYGTTTSYGSQTPTQGLAWSWQTETVGFSSNVGSLQPNTTYHWRAVAVDGNGWGTAYGPDATFTTPPAQTDGGLVVTGNSASKVTHSYSDQTNGWVTQDLPALVSSRWSRIWLVDKTTSFTDTVSIGFDFPTGGVSTYGSNYVLLYRPDASGIFTPLFVQTASASQTWVQFLVPGAQLQPGRYTLGQMISGTVVMVPQQASSIQAGVNAAGGGVVLVSPGTYNERVNVGDNGVTIMSLMGSTGDTSYISRTIIDGGGGGSVITAGDRNNGCGFVGLTIQNGSAQSGGGAYMGIYSSSSWTSCYFYNNRASSQGGAFFSGHYGSNSFTNCIFSGNSVTPGSQQSAYGGAICQTSYGNMSVSGCTFTNNKANGYYDPNWQQWTGRGYGGAIDFDFFSYGHLGVSNSTFTNNTAQQAGGAIYNGGGNGGMSTYNCVFNNNYGGGTLNGKTRRKDGDAPSPSSAELVEGGGAIYTTGNGHTLIVQSTIHDTATGERQGGVRADTATVDVISSIVSHPGSIPDTAVLEEAGLIRVAYSTVVDGWTGPGIGNISADPMFVDPAAGDFRLRPGSPAIDSGMPDVDADGRTWESDVDDREPDGTRVDMGALPYFRTPPAGLAVATVRSMTSAAAANTVRATVMPSPIRTVGTLAFTVERACDVRIELVDERGARVAVLADGPVEAGSHSVRIDAAELPAGLYFYRLTAGDATVGGAVIVAR